MTFFFRIVFSLLVLANCAAFAWFYPAHYKSVSFVSPPRIESSNLGVKLQLASELPRSFFRSTPKPSIESVILPKDSSALEAGTTDPVDEDVFLR